MKVLSLLAVTTAIGAACAAPAMAQDQPPPAPAQPEAAKPTGFYAGAGINLFFVDTDYLSEPFGVIYEDQPSPAAFMGRLGYHFTENLAVEVEAGIGGAKQDYTLGGGNTDGSIGAQAPLAAHVVGVLPFSGNGYIMAKAGYTTVKIEQELFGADAEQTVNGPSFGAGAGWRNGSLDFRFEYSMITGGTGESGVLGMFLINHF